MVGGEHADGPQRRVEVDAVARPRVVVDADVPGGEVHEARQRVQGGRLPGAVGAEHGDDLAVARTQRQVEVEGAAGDPQVGVEAHRSHRPRSSPRTPMATASMARLSATAVCGSSWRAT